MKVAEIRVVRNSVRTRKFTQITSGMTGAQVVFDFPAEWAGLTKNVRFACGDAAADVINVKEGQLIDIPNEVLAVPFNNLLLVGVTGFNADGKEIVPTTWGCICTLRRGSDSGFPAEPSSPSWAVQIQNEVNRAVDTAEDVERRADEGEFNGDSAYEIAVKNGFVGTEEEWLESLKADSVPESTIDSKDAAVLKTAKDYADSKLVTIDVESRSDGSFWTMPIDHDDPDAKRPTSLDIINMVNAGKWVRLHFFDTVTDTGDQIYTYETTIDGVPIFRRPVISTDKVSRISIGVQYNGEVRFIDASYEPPIQTAYAVCNDEAAPVELTGNVWYIPKTKPKPSGAVGMMLDVMWKNGRVNGLGYNPRLVWGAPGEVDNVEIVEASSVTDDLTGEYSIPVEGTVRYQLEEYSGRKRWRYVSGVLIPVQFSTATEADVADKLVPGLTLKYLPGMEVYLQMDKGNTAETMRLVPDEGQTLPVYGNGTGTKTGAISAGYILHLVNAGDHWQIMNGGSGGGGSGGVGQKTSDGGEIFNSAISAGENSHAEGMETNAIGRYSHTECLGERNEFENTTVSNTKVTEKRFDVDAAIGKVKMPYVAILYQNGIEKVSMLVKEVRNKGTTFTLIGYTRPTELVDGVYNLVLVKGITTKEAAHAEGTKTIANARHAHTEGDKTIVTSAVAKDGMPLGTGIAGHAEGTETMVYGENGHSEGFRTMAQGYSSHAEGYSSHAEGYSSHAQGYSSRAEGNYSHAEGESSHAEGESSHAEGYYSHAQGYYSHAEGESSHAEGYSSHAEGKSSHAQGYSSHAEGHYSHAEGECQHVQGKYNIPDTDDGTLEGVPSNKYAHIVGNGKYDYDTGKVVDSNAHTLDWDGNSWYQGNVLVGGKDMDAPNAGLLPDGVVIKSSTPDSAKFFKITVTDDGVIKASEFTWPAPPATVAEPVPTP